MRTITNDDIWSAIRGLGMFRLPDGEVEVLLAHHRGMDYFASRVIAEAARQVLAVRAQGVGRAA